MLYSSLVTVLFTLVLAESSDQAINESSAFTKSSEKLYPEFWVSDLFYKALANFTVKNVGSIACQNQGDMYDKHLQNHTNWAVKMAESWDRRPIGILGGKRYHFGVYDECVAVNHPVKGQYCLSEVKLTPIMENNYSSYKNENLDRVYDSHAWKTIQEWIDFPDQIQRNVLNFGVCIPDSCTALDLQTSLQIEMNRVFLLKKINASVKVDQIMCTVSENNYPYDTAYYITRAFFGLLIAICGGTTIYHYIALSCNQNKNKIGDYDSYIYSFSFIKSIKEFSRYEEGNELNIFNGFKFLEMSAILYGHRFMYFAGNPLIYSIPVEDIYSNGPMLLTSLNLVDVFFFNSGFLMFLTLSPVFKKSGPVWIKIISPIIYRIVRILPVYCAMMAITSHIMPHLGDGPLWPHKIWNEAEICKKYWWTNLLFISNFTDFKNQCLHVSWYLSCDIQFFFIGLIIVYIYMKNTKCGIKLLITSLGVSLLVPFIVTILTNSDGLPKVHFPLLEDPRKMNQLYKASYMRCAPFIIGLITGIVVEKLKEINFKLSHASVYGGTFIITVISIWTQMYGAIFFNRQRPYYALENALYLVLSRCTWSMIGAWLLVCHFTTGYGLLMKVVDNRVFVPLGRLTYSVFLVNMPLFMISQYSQKTTQHFSITSTLDLWIHDTFKSYVIGLFLYLIVEAPFGNILRILFGRGKQEKSSTNGVTAVASSENTDIKETDLKFKKT